MATTVEVLSLSAASISALGTVFAAYAAKRSADSAKEAQDALTANEKRVRALAISDKSAELAAEAKRTDWALNRLRMAYKVHFALAGRSGSEGQHVEIAERKCAPLLDQARMLGVGSLEYADYLQSSDDDLLKKHLEISRCLAELSDTREQIEMEYEELTDKSEQVRAKSKR